MKKAGGPGAIGVPPAPDPFAVMLISNDQLFQGGRIKVKLAPCAQGFNCPDEYEIGRAGTKTGRGRGRQNEKLAGLKMCRALKTDLGEMRNRITAALRHLFDLFENQAVVIAREGDVGRQSEDCNQNRHAKVFHAG